MIEHTDCSLLRMPIWVATCATLLGPTSSTSWAKIVLTEWARESSTLIVPADSSAKLLTCQGPFGPWHRGSAMVKDGGPDITACGSMRSCIAAV